MEIGGQMDRYISGVNMITGLGVMDPSTDRRHTGWYEADVADRKIERLEKEKEWLLNSYVQIQHMPNSLNMADKNQIRGDIIRRMQQALKKNG